MVRKEVKRVKVIHLGIKDLLPKKIHVCHQVIGSLIGHHLLIKVKS